MECWSAIGSHPVNQSMVQGRLNSTTQQQSEEQLHGGSSYSPKEHPLTRLQAPATMLFWGRGATSALYLLFGRPPANIEQPMIDMQWTSWNGYMTSTIMPVNI
jgi:hypothetical protein